MSGIHRGAWAIEARAKMNPQTRADVDAIARELRVSKEAGTAKFNILAHERKWKLGEAAAIADVAKGLARADFPIPFG